MSKVDCDRRYYAKNREKIRVYNQEWRERTKEARRLYRFINRDKRKAQHREYKDANRERTQELNRLSWARCRDRDPEVFFRHRQLQTKRWRDNNRERFRELSKIHQHRRRARKFCVGGSFTKEEWLRILMKYENRCPSCGERKKLTQDHIVPLSRGGDNTISNIQPLCLHCNCKKSRFLLVCFLPWNFGRVSREAHDAHSEVLSLCESQP